MRGMRQSAVGILATVVIAVGCASQSQPAQQASSAEGPKTAGRTRITAAILGDPYTLSATVNTAGTGGQPGVEEIEKLIHAGLSISDDRGVLRPQLGEAVPSLESGEWRVQPDGRMELTWKIKPNARWQDGTPVTSAD